MYSTKNTFSEKGRTQIAALLQNHLANSIDLGSQAKQAHWNVKGPDFMALHGLFDQLSESVEGYIDLIAERIVQLGGIAEGTLKVTATRSELPAYSLTLSSGMQHVAALATALAYYGESIQKAAGLVEEIDDQLTADLLIEVARGTDKYLWMIEAHLQAGK